MAAALLLDAVSRSYGPRLVLDRVSFSVPPASIFGILGPNGAGKTTLFSVVAGYIRADSGRVEIDGHGVDQALGMVGVLPQDARFQGDLPILEQLSWLLRFRGRSRTGAEAEVARMLDRVGLRDYLARRATELSHGMYKRLALAQAFLGTPPLVLLDEPTAGLDPVNARIIRGLIREVRSREVAVVVSSHDLGEMQELCDGVVILDRGSVRAAGPVAELCRRRRVLRLLPERALSAAECAEIARVPGVVACTAQADSTLHLALAEDGHNVELAVQGRLIGLGIMVRRCELGDSLEDVFLALTATAPAATLPAGPAPAGGPPR
jgi:ABC-2 type transport system ATP-binding protein